LCTAKLKIWIILYSYLYAAIIIAPPIRSLSNSIFENDEKESRKLIKKIFKTSGKSVVIGITGPAGAGKSSLIDKTSI